MCERLRSSGKLRLVTAECTISDNCTARQQAWTSLSDAGTLGTDRSPDSQSFNPPQPTDLPVSSSPRPPFPYWATMMAAYLLFRQ